VVFLSSGLSSCLTASSTRAVLSEVTWPAVLVAHRAEVRGMLHFQYECQRAVDDDLDEVCCHKLALSAIDAG
jgi:hypothetical protein